MLVDCQLRRGRLVLVFLTQLLQILPCFTDIICNLLYLQFLLLLVVHYFFFGLLQEEDVLLSIHCGLIVVLDLSDLLVYCLNPVLVERKHGERGPHVKFIDTVRQIDG